MVLLVRRREHLGLIDVVDPHRFENLGFYEMADADLGHHRDADGIHDLLDQGRVAHARHTTVGANICGNAFERHHGDGARLFGDASMFGGDHVHDHPAF